MQTEVEILTVVKYTQIKMIKINGKISIPCHISYTYTSMVKTSQFLGIPYMVLRPSKVATKLGACSTVTFKQFSLDVSVIYENM